MKFFIFYSFKFLYIIGKFSNVNELNYLFFYIGILLNPSLITLKTLSIVRFLHFSLNSIKDYPIVISFKF
jgi:hypothetical protein